AFAGYDQQFLAVIIPQHQQVVEDAEVRPRHRNIVVRIHDQALADANVVGLSNGCQQAGGEDEVAKRIVHGIHSLRDVHSTAATCSAASSSGPGSGSGLFTAATRAPFFRLFWPIVITQSPGAMPSTISNMPSFTQPVTTDRRSALPSLTTYT